MEKWRWQVGWCPLCSGQGSQALQVACLNSPLAAGVKHRNMLAIDAPAGVATGCCWGARRPGMRAATPAWRDLLRWRRLSSRQWHARCWRRQVCMLGWLLGGWNGRQGLMAGRPCWVPHVCHPRSPLLVKPGKLCVDVRHPRCPPRRCASRSAHRTLPFQPAVALPSVPHDWVHCGGCPSTGCNGPRGGSGAAAPRAQLACRPWGGGSL